MNCDQFTNSSQINNLLNSGRNNVSPSNMLNMVNEEYNSNNLEILEMLATMYIILKYKYKCH